MFPNVKNHTDSGQQRSLHHITARKHIKYIRRMVSSAYFESSVEFWAAMMDRTSIPKHVPCTYTSAMHFVNPNRTGLYA